MNFMRLKYPLLSIIDENGTATHWHTLAQIINVGCPQMDNKWLGVWFVEWINDEKCPFLANNNMKCGLISQNIYQT